MSSFYNYARTLCIVAPVVAASSALPQELHPSAPLFVRPMSFVPSGVDGIFAPPPVLTLFANPRFELALGVAARLTPPVVIGGLHAGTSIGVGPRAELAYTGGSWLQPFVSAWAFFDTMPVATVSSAGNFATTAMNEQGLSLGVRAPFLIDGLSLKVSAGCALQQTTVSTKAGNYPLTIQASQHECGGTAGIGYRVWEYSLSNDMWGFADVNFDVHGGRRFTDSALATTAMPGRAGRLAEQAAGTNFNHDGWAGDIRPSVNAGVRFSTGDTAGFLPR